MVLMFIMGNENIPMRPSRIKSRVVMLSKFNLDLARSLELLRFSFDITSIDILNLILHDFLNIGNFCKYVIRLGVSLAALSRFSITSF